MPLRLSARIFKVYPYVAYVRNDIYITVSQGRHPQRANETQATGKNSAIVVHLLVV